MSAKCVLFLALLSGLGCSKQYQSDIASTLSKHAVWITKAIKWEKAPKEINPNLSIGEATILCFAPGGYLGILNCRVTQIDGKLAVSVGDGYVVRQGQWKTDDDKIVLNHQLVYETLPPVQGRAYPGPEKVEFATLEEGMNPEIRLSEHVFVPVDADKGLSPDRLQKEFFRYAPPVR
jgi:hypothetical protein